MGHNEEKLVKHWIEDQGFELAIYIWASSKSHMHSTLERIILTPSQYCQGPVTSVFIHETRV